MTKFNWQRFQQSEKQKQKNAALPRFTDKTSTRLQVDFACRLLLELGLDRPEDKQNLRAMRRRELSALINKCLDRKRNRHLSDNKPSPFSGTNRSRDNHPTVHGPSQGENGNDVAAGTSSRNPH